MTVLNDDCYNMQDWLTVMNNYLCKIEKGEVTFLFTGISDVDNKLDIKNGDVIVVLSKSIMYTAVRDNFVTDCIFNVANSFIEEKPVKNNNKCILYFDFKHSANNIAKNFISRRNAILKHKDMDFVRLGCINDLATFIQETKEFPIYFNDCIGKIPDIGFISECMFKFCKENKEKIGLVVIEELDSLFFDSKDYYMAMKQIKKIANCFDVPILVLAQHKFDIDFDDDDRVLTNLYDIKCNTIPADKIILEHDKEIIIAQGRCGMDGRGFDRCRLDKKASENVEDDIPF